MPKRIERSLEEAATFLGSSLEAERAAGANGWLQRRDPRAKILAALFVLLASGLVRHPQSLLALYAVLLAAAAASRLNLVRLLRREWLVTAAFSGLVALPVIFARVTPGPVALVLPGGIALSRPGLIIAFRLLMRAVISVHTVLTLTQTTPWHRVLRGLRGLGVPAVAILILEVSHRYVYLLISTAQEMLTGRAARRVGPITGAESRRQIAASAGALLLRSQDTGAAVFSAMSARGYRGEPKDLRPLAWQAGDICLVLLSLGLCAILVVADAAVKR